MSDFSDWMSKYNSMLQVTLRSEKQQTEYRLLESLKNIHLEEKKREMESLKKRIHQLEEEMKSYE
jgi:hypothetical protein